MRDRINFCKGVIIFLILKMVRGDILEPIIRNYNYKDFGFLVIRATFSFLMFFYHGHNKLMGGVARWEKLGSALTNLIGLSFLKTFFGFMASMSESIFAILLLFGLMTRLSSLLLLITMLVASAHHLVGQKFPEMAILYATFCILMLVAGPGKYSIDNYLTNKLKD